MATICMTLKFDPIEKHFQGAKKRETIITGRKMEGKGNTSVKAMVTTGCTVGERSNLKAERK